jgi:hypothetical protein
VALAARRMVRERARQLHDIRNNGCVALGIAA